MFKVTVVGDYIARSGISDKERIKKHYEVEANIHTLVGVLSIIKNKILPVALPRKYADYVTYSTHSIAKVVPLDEEGRKQFSRVDVDFMDRETLVQYIAENNIGACQVDEIVGIGEDGKQIKQTKEYPRLDPRYFPDLFLLRERVKAAKEDAPGFHKWFKLHKTDLELDIQVAAANPELFNQKVDASLVAEKPTSKPKRLTPEARIKQTTDRVEGLAAEQRASGEIGPEDPTPETGIGDL
jgi:hypothetical protein